MTTTVMRIRTLLGLAVCAGAPLHAQSSRRGYVPSNGFVPDSVTAVRVAQAIWTPIYGERTIAKEQPYRATLVRGIWHVQGSHPPRMPGGVAEIRIRKADGRILSVWHGR